MAGLAAFHARHRRRLARLLLLLGAVLLARQLLPLWPRTTELEFELGPEHAAVVELRVAYVDHGEELHGVSFGFPAGAPAKVRHRLSLPPGELDLVCELRERGGHAQRLLRHLHTPTDGVVRIALGDKT